MNPAQAICARFGLNWEIEADRIVCEAAWDAAREAAWQPIETAPRDEPILLSTWHDGTLFWAASGELSSEDGKYYINLTDEPLRYSRKATFAEPTHWQPITPPETSDD